MRYGWNKKIPSYVTCKSLSKKSSLLYRMVAARFDYFVVIFEMGKKVVNYKFYLLIG